MLGFSLYWLAVFADHSPGALASVFLLEDGTSSFLLEDGTGVLLMEEG